MARKNKSNSARQLSDEKSFVENLYRDELRCGFLVTSHRKKLWNVQIGLINEFARICDKHNIKWFSYGGTTLGAARHKGFIPWDDDVDIVMFRPDYEKFKVVAEKEVKYPYFVDNWYNYRLESDEILGIKSDPTLPLITVNNQKNHWVGHPTFPIIKLRDSRTSMIEFPDRLTVNQGIWIDIFPLDPVPPFSEERQAINFEIAKLLLLATAHPEYIRELLKQNPNLPIPKDKLQQVLNSPFQTRGMTFDKFVSDNFFDSACIADIDSYCYSTKKNLAFETECYADKIYMPFEKIQIPVPTQYDKLLTTQYGDWRKFKIFATHTVDDYSADIPYTEYYKRFDFLK